MVIGFQVQFCISRDPATSNNTNLLPKHSDSMPTGTNRNSAATIETDRNDPFVLLLKEIGVERKDVPALTNGDLSRIANVDLGTLHGWQFFDRDLPEEALQRLRDHFCEYRSE
ncbi:hypothetical protein Q31b_16780 [Novipirellula aureliae]|uniref:Uncharacterized protein n=1 Tax=Novipirellula aureliae TaxID=2527966 RepID=A0A5C6E5C4_9BACT|nr:hypothetical protein [Novipirellula aureliae]TWU44142.1 hypothetical protein Q31b_16780 [Novipirellula aureliae]